MRKKILTFFAVCNLLATFSVFAEECDCNGSAEKCTCTECNCPSCGL